MIKPGKSYLMNRLLLPKLLTLVVLVVLVGRLYQLQVAPDEAARYRDSTQARTQRYLPIRPIRGEIFAADQHTLLAESVPIYTVSIRPADLPSPITEPAARSEVFSRLSQLLTISNTLTISPATALDDTVLRNDITQGIGAASIATARHFEEHPPALLRLAPEQRQGAAQLVARYRPLAEFGPSRRLPSTSGTPVPDTQPITLDGGTIITTTSTLVISPSSTLDTNSALRDDIGTLLGPAALSAIARPRDTSWV